MTSPIFESEIDINDINPNYFCTDQTNMNQELTTRNFYDSALINLYAPNSNLVIGNCLYNSVNCQSSKDFSQIVQNIWSLLTVNYNGIVGSINVNYPVINSEYINYPSRSTITSATGVFSSLINNNVIVSQSSTNPSRVLFTIF